MNVEKLDGKLYLEMVRMGAQRLAAGRKEINDLNVFPIPDGDTGDNMYMTIESGCAKAQAVDSISAVAKSVAGGMLFGARGNSGVILSRIFAGLSRGLDGQDCVDPQAFVAALGCSVEDAYKAVSSPVEGTMLTVLREGVAAAGGDDFETVLGTVCKAMEESLERTPELLEVLKLAGVVDSGGAGLVRIFRGMEAAITGERSSATSTDTVLSGAADVNLDAFGPDSELEFGYCTEFLLRLQTSKVDPDSFDPKVISDYLNSVGESVVCFRDGSIVKVHVHTRTPGEILNYCQEWGEYLTVKIENMTLQHHETHKRAAVRKKYATVTVSAGEGLCSMFKELGADVVIEGGQTMNPSAERFVEAFREVNADTVYVLPNNSNIILTAGQAASLYGDSKVVVIPTRTLGAGIITMGSVDFSSDPDEVLSEAQEVAGSVVCGAVSRAVRDTDVVRKDGFIGFRGGQILCGGESRPEVVNTLADKMDAGSSDVLMLFRGAEAPVEEAEKLCSELQKSFPRVEVIFRDGGQPVYDYMLILQ